MTPTEYLAALYAAGLDRDLPAHELDRQAAALLQVTTRTARRYRSGTTKIPGPVGVALRCIADSKAGSFW